MSDQELGYATAALNDALLQARMTMTNQHIQKLHHRTGDWDGYVALYVQPGVPVQSVIVALTAGGLECVRVGSRLVVREK